MFLIEDLSIKEIPAPITKYCCSGHMVPEMFRREGPDSPEEPTKFFQVTGKGINGIYCEPCLIVANYISQQKKKNKVIIPE